MSRKYTTEFKQEAVKLVIEQGYSQIEVSRNLGISDSNIHRWVKEYLEDKANKKEMNKKEQNELEKLRKENAQLKMERAILKKAAAFFAKESN